MIYAFPKNGITTAAFVVIERSIGGLSGSGFFLVYGEDDNATCGTGHFATFEAARDWFTNGGH